MKTIEERLDALEKRNKRVELDKTWESSLERRTAILVMTYVIIGIFLILIGNSNPWINAIVPSIGFTLSTLTLRWLKQIWIHAQLKD